MLRFAFAATVLVAVVLAVSSCTSPLVPDLESQAAGPVTLRPDGDSLPPFEFALPRGAGGNAYPIVFVGGFGTWGRDEALGVKYFGGLVDLQERLNDDGHRVVTSEVGPLSSYWDRACELYAQIKGTRVDYGIGHSARFGHERFGRDYTGRALVPGWGDTVRKVHFIAHSMGGPTVRALIALLEDGSSEDWDGSPDSLFAGGKRWASGVVTLSSPHDGTTLTSKWYPIVGDFKGSGVQRAAVAMISLIGGGCSLYDFKLDQFGLTKRGKTWDEYLESVMTSSLWTTTKDLSSWDGSPEGAREFNAWARTCDDVYYFSWATEATWRELFTGRQLPEATMNPIWTVPGFATHMGRFTQSGGDLVPIDGSWWKNDGVVNTISMDGPTLGCENRIVAWNGAPRVGMWNYLGRLEGTDHSDVIGFTPFSVTAFYRSMAELLESLPE
jgi:triacylglycerol lipase